MSMTLADTGILELPFRKPVVGGYPLPSSFVAEIGAAPFRLPVVLIGGIQ